jgi:hypothetical protein
MPGNFKDPLTIDGQGRISPHGDLTRAKGETLTKLYVLV